MPETVSPMLPNGAGRTEDWTYPGINQPLTKGASGATGYASARNQGPDFSIAAYTSYAGGTGVVDVQDGVKCYRLNAPAGQGASIIFGYYLNPLLTQLVVNQPLYSFNAMRIVMLMKGTYTADVGNALDHGMCIGQGTNLPAFTMFNNVMAGIEFGPRANNRITLLARANQGGAVTLAQDVAANYMANIDPTKWNAYELRIISATDQTPAVLKPFINGVQVIPSIIWQPGVVLPDQVVTGGTGLNTSGFKFGSVNLNCPNGTLAVGPTMFHAAPNEISLF